LYLAALAKELNRIFHILVNILDISWVFSLVMVVLFAVILLKRELDEIEDPKDKIKRRKTVILIILFSFVLFLVLPLFLSIF
jgi:hypothetical protein